jgi:hypothetical protein
MVGTMLQVLAVVWIVHRSVLSGATITYASARRVVLRLWAWAQAVPSRVRQWLDDWLRRFRNRFRSTKELTFRSESHSTSTST